MKEGNWKYKLWVCLTYDDKKARTLYEHTKRYGWKAETTNLYGELDEWMRRLKTATKAHWSCEAGYAAEARGEKNQHIHVALASPDCTVKRYLKASSFCKDSMNWPHGRIIDVKPWDDSKRNQGLDYVRRHEYTEGLGRYVYCPLQSNSCRKGRCKHKKVL